VPLENVTGEIEQDGWRTCWFSVEEDSERACKRTLEKPWVSNQRYLTPLMTKQHSITGQSRAVLGFTKKIPPE